MELLLHTKLSELNEKLREADNNLEASKRAEAGISHELAESENRNRLLREASMEDKTEMERIQDKAVRLEESLRRAREELDLVIQSKGSEAVQALHAQLKSATDKANFLERKVEELQEELRLAKKQGVVGDAEVRWAVERAENAEAEQKTLAEKVISEHKTYGFLLCEAMVWCEATKPNQAQARALHRSLCLSP